MKKSLKPEGQMLRGVVYWLIESLASMGHCSIWKLNCAISVCNTLTVGVHLSSPLSSTPSISGPGSATDVYTVCLFRTSLRWFFSKLSGFPHQLNRPLPPCWYCASMLVAVNSKPFFITFL